MSSAVIIEVSSIAKGYHLLDQSLKASRVHVIEASSVSPGKFIIILRGDLTEVEKARTVVHNSARDMIIDSGLLPNLNSDIFDALYGLSKNEAPAHGLVVVETATLSAMLIGLHVLAAKQKISVIEVRSGRGIGGKSTACFFTEAHLMDESLDQFLRAAKSHGGLAQGYVVSQPHPDFLKYFNISGE